MHVRQTLPSSSWEFLRWFFTAPLRRQTYANLTYLALAFPLGIAYFVVLVTGFAIGAVSTVLLIGFPLLVGMVYLVRELTAFERWLAERLLAVDVPTETEPMPSEPVENLRYAFTDVRT